MDRNTTIVCLVALVMVGGGLYWATQASIQNTKFKADATVAKAQEHTRRAEGRHDLVDVMGLIRGWKSQREDR